MPRRGTRHRIAQGISRDGSGYSVRFQVAGKPVEKRFPLDTTVDLAAWRATQITRRKDARTSGRLEPGTFAADAARYLASVTALPQYQQRVRDIDLWEKIFGSRLRSSIQSWEIRQVRDQWLTVGPKRVMRRARGKKGAYIEIAAPLAPNTVALRMRALENLWSVLDGKRAPNPVRDVEEPQDRDAEPRGLPYNVVDYLLGLMPKSSTRARLKVMAYTGLSQIEIKGLSPHDVDLDARTVWVRRRRKGRGGKMAAPAVQPLNRFGVAAFREFAAVNAWGAFSTSSLWGRFQAVVRRANRLQPSLRLQGLRPYDLRHSYGTAHFRASGNVLATQEALRQRSPVTTRRYVAAAVAPALLEASQRLERLIQRQRRTPTRAPSGAQFRPSPGHVTDRARQSRPRLMVKNP